MADDMKVLYGVNGEGMGHATRSEVVIDALLERHDVRVVAGGAAFKYLSERLPRVDEIFGPSFALEEGEIQKWASVRQSLHDARLELPDTMRHWMSLVHEWRPDVVITDFEPLAGVYARTTRTPLIAIDNIHMLVRCHHDERIVGAQHSDFMLACGVTRAMVPGAISYIVTTFFDAPVAYDGTTLVPPILRPEIIAAESTRGEHLLVYSSGEEELLDEPPALGPALPRLRDARRSGRRGRGGREPRVPAALERGLRGGPRERPRGHRRRRLFAPERGGLPGKAGPVGSAARPVRAAHERPVSRAQRLRALRDGGDPRGPGRLHRPDRRVRRGPRGLRAGGQCDPGRDRGGPRRGGGRPHSRRSFAGNAAGAKGG